MCLGWSSCGRWGAALCLQEGLGEGKEWGGTERPQGGDGHLVSADSGDVGRKAAG